MTDKEISTVRGYLKSIEALLKNDEVANKGLFKLPKAFPVLPTFVSPVTIIPSDEFSQGLFNYTLINAAENGGGDVILNGNFNHGFSIRRADGSATNKYRFKPTIGTILGGAAGSEPGVSQTDYGNNQEYYGDTLNLNPIVVKGERGMGGFVARVGGANYVIRDVVGKSNTAATIQANGNTSGGSLYASWIQSYCRSFLSGQEAIAYLGKTSSGGAVFTSINLSHNFGYSPYRDGWQIAQAAAFAISNQTVIGAGRGGEAGQTNNFQIHASKGTVNYGIYDNGGTLFTIFANGYTLANNYISAVLPGYIGKSDDLGLFFNSAGLNVNIDGTTAYIENNYFKNKGVATYAFEIAESKCDIVIRNNVFQDYTNAFLDSRGAHTNTITGNIGDNGNVSATVIEPAYGPDYANPDNYTAQGLLHASSPYWALKFGYRNPLN